MTYSSSGVAAVSMMGSSHSRTSCIQVDGIVDFAAGGFHHVGARPIGLHPERRIEFGLETLGANPVRCA